MSRRVIVILSPMMAAIVRVMATFLKAPRVVVSLMSITVSGAGGAVGSAASALVGYFSTRNG